MTVSTSGQDDEPIWRVPYHYVQSSGPYRYIQSGLGHVVDVLRTTSLPLFGERPTPAQAADQALKEWAQNPTNATKLRRALRVIDDVDWRTRVLGIVEFNGLLKAGGNLLSPKGPGTCDCNACERCCNVITSFPYIVTGVRSMKNRKTREGRLWGASIAAVGAASTGFHASSGRWRDLGRKLDYWSIALSSNLLVRAVYPQMPLAATVVGMLATPFRPFFVSALNSGLMETKFLRRSLKNKDVRNAQIAHSACCALGLTAFLLEDLRPGIPLMHATWHCLSAAAVGSTNVLLEDIERNELQGMRAPAGATAGHTSSNNLPQPRVGSLLADLGHDLRPGWNSAGKIASDLKRIGSLRVQRDDDGVAEE